MRPPGPIMSGAAWGFLLAPLLLWGAGSLCHLIVWLCS